MPAYRRRPYARKPAKSTVRRYAKGKKYTRTSAAVKTAVNRALARQVETKWNVTSQRIPLVNGCWQYLQDTTALPINSTGSGRVGEWIDPTKLMLRLSLLQGLSLNTIFRIIVFKPKIKNWGPTPDAISGASLSSAGTVVRGSLTGMFQFSPGQFDGYLQNQTTVGQSPVQMLLDKWIKPTGNPSTPLVFTKTIPLKGKIHYTPNIGSADYPVFVACMAYNEQQPSGIFLASANAGETSNYSGTRANAFITDESNANIYATISTRMFYRDP